MIADILFVAISCFVAFSLRFDGNIPKEYLSTLGIFILMVIPLTIFYFYLEKLYSISWSFVSIRDLLKLTRGVALAFFTVGIILFVLRHLPFSKNFPRSIIFATGMLVFFLTGALRFGKRIYLHGLKRGMPTTGSRTLIIGAGDAGEQLVRHMLTSANKSLIPVGFIDDNPMKQGISIHGIRVIGKRADLTEIIKKFNIQELIIAMPSVEQKIIQETVRLGRQCNIKKIKILPGTKEILEEKVHLKHIRDISIEDLLGRDAVKIDTQLFHNFLGNKKILVTGAAGSIGSYLCKQILKFNPEQLIGLDCNETGIFHLKNALDKQKPKVNKAFVIGNVCDKDKMHNVFAKFQPQIVFHAAAYKHVPLMEDHPDEAVRNNIFGTLTVGQTALKHKTEKFILISTDKAINPSSIMGATKHIGEKVCVLLNNQNSTQFCAVRFGNVLDSQGNVVEIFNKQIKQGGPVSITHPEMKRYFMVTAEACLLVMQAGALSTGGEVFVLDMGKPHKIVNLAKEMIRLSGYEPDVDIPIIFTKIRPGEKLFEEILTKNEQPTKHDKIYISKLLPIDEQALLESLRNLKNAIEKQQTDTLINIIQELVPFHK